ncbi:MAG: response regulator transcription factor [Pseudomonadales bacterium]|nr:response regulator transcription factor [Pseudomonadales bacterium]MCP5333113.1 response regulator transcription factor [Pseudomonadales bacterium]
MIMRNANTVLIVDDVPDNLAVLHDALDESGFTVLVAVNGESALSSAVEAQPDIILLDALMPSMDGFEVCRRLKADLRTQHIPVIFMTGLTESEHVVNGFVAGGVDYVTKPIRISEVLARIATHLHTAHSIQQMRGVLDAFGQAAIAVLPHSGRIIWQTPLARILLHKYLGVSSDECSATPPEPLLKWLMKLSRRGSLKCGMDSTPQPLTIVQPCGRLRFIPTDLSSDEQWTLLLREESDVVQIDALIARFHLTRRESEVLCWVIKGKTDRDIGQILGTSHRTVNKHLEHLFIKLGVETRTAAAAVAVQGLHGVGR